MPLLKLNTILKFFTATILEWKNLFKQIPMKFNENFYPGLSEYKKVVYLPPFDKNVDLKTLKGHVSMEVDYSKATGLYTLVFYIFEH